MQFTKIMTGTLVGMLATVAVACAPAIASDPRAETVAVTGESYIDEHQRLLQAEGVEFNESTPSRAVAVTGESYIDEHERLLEATGVEFESMSSKVTASSGESDIDEHERLLEAAGVSFDDSTPNVVVPVDGPLPWYAVEHAALLEGALPSAS